MSKKIAILAAAALATACTSLSASEPVAEKTVAPAATPTEQPKATQPKILMLRWFVSDMERATLFYKNVFGMTVGPALDGSARIMLFPGGATPGLILIQSPEETQMNGSFIIQVADVQATLGLAQANGAKLLNTNYSQDVGGAAARSSHFIDPDGNVIEVLQMRSANK